MTTAARPTFEPARGGTGARERDLSAMSKQYSSRDLPSHTSLKSRERGQNVPEELAGRDFKKDLEEREKEAARERESSSSSLKRGDRDSRSSRLALQSITSSSSGGAKKVKLEANVANLDADDPLEESGNSDDSDSEDDDDDTAALMAELQKIKREKAAEEREKEEERKQEQERIRMENILTGNPLLKDKYSATADKSSLKVKRRWDDDVVFKNCSRAEPDKEDKTFINDSLRSEFHRKFMDKYIK